MSNVLFDAPGPRARVRHRYIGAITLVAVVAIFAFILLRFVETGQFTAEKWELFTIPFVHAKILEATIATLQAFGLAAVLSLILGLLLLVGRVSKHRWISVPTYLFVELFRAIPLLILMMIMYYGLPPLGFSFVTPFIAVVTGLTLYNGSVLSEVFRAGIESLPKGQAEAAYAIGMSKTQVMRMILLPQALRAMAPVIVSQLVVVLKDTALGFIVTYQELLYLAKFYGAQPNYGSPIIPSTIVMAAIYISLCLLLAGVAKYIEVRTKRGPAKNIRAQQLVNEAA
ncbi:amino acid ABC transporter permease [Cryobacterium sp. Y29]|uniref:amino acid ABC transporter permease n=1 Tax=Cryobacterium sp. Y29 TaxID=2048285 RepID=UPI000CE4139B|nr:amino acid ABC transporter permease [Cryobacterium sp. Y29]